MEQNKALALPRGEPSTSEASDLAQSHQPEGAEGSRPMQEVIVPPCCPGCKQPARLVSGSFLYPHIAKLRRSWFWLCSPCAAWVYCYAGTRRPSGPLADARVRRAREWAHAAFDPIWEGWAKQEGGSRSAARRAAYSWLSSELGIVPDKCHIGLFGLEECNRVVQLCKMHSAATEAAKIRGIPIGTILSNTERST